jgi:hypothetical protein
VCCTRHLLLRGDPCLQLVNTSSKWDIHVYSWPTPALKVREIPFYHLERTPMLYLPPCKGRTFSTAGQHQLKKGDPCLQLQGRTYSTAGQHQLKGISLSASGQHQLLRGDPCLQLVNPSSKWDIHVYSWPTPAIKGRSSLQKGRSLSTADQHQLKR